MDSGLRELERRAQGEGAREDVLAYLHAVLRAGAAAEQSALLQWLADDARRPVEQLVGELAGFGREPLVRACLTIARGLLGLWNAHHERDHRPSQALDAAERWLECPCEEHVAVASERAEDARQAAAGLRDRLEADAWDGCSEEDDDESEPVQTISSRDLPRLMVDEASDEELWSAVRTRGEDLDPAVMDELRERVDSEDSLADEIVEDLELDLEPVEGHAPDRRESARTELARSMQVTELEYEQKEVEQLDSIAELASLTAAACAQELEQLLPGLQELMQDLTKGRQLEDLDGGSWNVWSPSLVTPEALQDVVQDALRRWTLGLGLRVPVELGLQRPRAAEARALDALPADRLELLAWTQHPEAMSRSGISPPAAIEAWASGLARFGQEICARAALAAAERALVHWDRDEDARPANALAAVRAWIACPCPSHARELESALDRAVEAMTAARGRAAGSAEVTALAAEVALAAPERLPVACAEVLEAAARVVPAGAVRAAVALALWSHVLE